MERDDRLGYSLCMQYEIPKRSYILELLDRGTSFLTDFSCDSNLEHNPIDLDNELVYHYSKSLHQIEAKIENDTKDE